MEVLEEEPAKWKVKRVLRYGHSRALTLTPFLPEGWRNVKVRLERRDADEVVLRIRRLG
jgi:hypothetical protein